MPVDCGAPGSEAPPWTHTRQSASAWPQMHICV